MTYTRLIQNIDPIQNNICPITSATIQELVQEQDQVKRPTIISLVKEVLSQEATYFHALSLDKYFIEKNSLESPLSRQQYARVTYLWNVSLENLKIDPSSFHEITTVSNQDFAQSHSIHYSQAYTEENAESRLTSLITLIEHAATSTNQDELKFHCSSVYDEFLRYNPLVSESLLQRLEKTLSSLNLTTTCKKTQTLIQLIRYFAKILETTKPQPIEEENPLAGILKGIKLENNFLRTNKDRKEALLIFEDILKVYPNNEIAKYYVLKIVSETNPKDTRLSTMKTLCELKTYDYALNVNPQDVFALANIGIIHYQNGNLLKAKECFKKSLGLEPNHEITALHWGTMLFKGQAVPQNYQRARIQFHKVLKINPQNAPAQYYLGMIYKNGNPKLPVDTNKALSYFKECLQNAPGHPEALFELSSLILRNNYFQNEETVSRTIELVEKKLTMHPDSQNTQEILGRLLLLPLEKTYDSKRGIELLETALKNNPTKASLALFLANIYIDGTPDILPDITKAQTFIEQAKVVLPMTPEGIYTVGKIIPRLPEVTYAELTETINKVKILNTPSASRSKTLILINLLLTALHPKFLPSKIRITSKTITPLTTQTAISLFKEIQELCSGLLKINSQDQEAKKGLLQAKNLITRGNVAPKTPISSISVSKNSEPNKPNK